MTQPDDELLPCPCPFCGSDNIEIEMRERPWGIMQRPMEWYELTCRGCLNGSDYPSKKGLIEKWNRRPTPRMDDQERLEDLAALKIVENNMPHKGARGGCGCPSCKTGLPIWQAFDRVRRVARRALSAPADRAASMAPDQDEQIMAYRQLLIERDQERAEIMAAVRGLNEDLCKIRKEFKYVHKSKAQEKYAAVISMAEKEGEE